VALPLGKFQSLETCAVAEPDPDVARLVRAWERDSGAIVDDECDVRICPAPRDLLVDLWRAARQAYPGRAPQPAEAREPASTEEAQRRLLSLVGWALDRTGESLAFSYEELLIPRRTPPPAPASWEPEADRALAAAGLPRWMERSVTVYGTEPGGPVRAWSVHTARGGRVPHVFVDDGGRVFHVVLEGRGAMRRLLDSSSRTWRPRFDPGPCPSADCPACAASLTVGSRARAG
jgi:hypothetical protein